MRKGEVGAKGKDRGGKGKGKEEKEKRTEAMNIPKTPPSAKPAPPLMTVFAKQDSMAFCNCIFGYRS